MYYWEVPIWSTANENVCAMLTKLKKKVKIVCHPKGKEKKLEIVKENKYI